MLFKASTHGISPASYSHTPYPGNLCFSDTDLLSITCNHLCEWPSSTYIPLKCLHADIHIASNFIIFKRCLKHHLFFSPYLNHCCSLAHANHFSLLLLIDTWKVPLVSVNDTYTCKLLLLLLKCNNSQYGINLRKTYVTDFLYYDVISAPHWLNLWIITRLQIFHIKHTIAKQKTKIPKKQAMTMQTPFHRVVLHTYYKKDI